MLTANFHAFLWTREGGIRNLRTLPGDVLSQATGINDFGQIAGTSFDANFNSRVFLWQDGVRYDLNTLLQPNAPLYLLASGDINDRGEITGLACVVASGTCSSVLHTFVAIVAPATSAGAASASPGADLTAMRPAVPDEFAHACCSSSAWGAWHASGGLFFDASRPSSAMICSSASSSCTRVKVR